MTIAASDTGTVTLELPLPPPCLHSNARAHWRRKAEATKKRRHEVATVAALYRLPSMPWSAATIQPIFYMPRTRDGDGLNAWLKATVDALADAGYVLNDSAFTLLPPKQVIGKERKLILEITRA